MGFVSEKFGKKKLICGVFQKTNYKTKEPVDGVYVAFGKIGGKKYVFEISPVGSNAKDNQEFWLSISAVGQKSANKSDGI